ncbi:ERI1 exoribonuclease 3 [Phymastichus coffea]|uniref:ERI1 exoribonuclease 3 n=1 Tax=Phymastichus coffea TaxID=108790 RepID=UPI00273AE0A6|nr:ERI1 exoribonuclease 3 [Phymastichus coffea]XP_058794722.1 ERI1 exoribonuclease 3 [Phymastichus coffea]XP_058794723.1 ERI1 exoribonuclease 3 [Phymastichus coffea]
MLKDVINMAHRALMGISKNLPKRVFKQIKPFQNLLVLDFEATCKKSEILKPQEIIEFPCLVLSCDDWEVKDVFHRYVKPKVHVELSTFCSELTGITTDTLEDEQHFPQVFLDFCEWIKSGHYFDEKDESAFVTCGDWDLKVMLPNQCQLENIKIPDYFDEWINLKTSFYTFTNYYPKSLNDMLRHFKMEFKGKSHCGLDDAHNIARIVQTLGNKYNNKFVITTKINE